MKQHNHEFALMTSLQVEDYLKKGGDMVLIPVGSTEQHGPYGPLGTDHLIAQEVCRRVAPQLNALVAPPIAYALSILHRGRPGVVYAKMESFLKYVEDIALSLNEGGFRRMIFVNGHYDNGPGVTFALRSIYDRFAPDTFAFCFNYWDALKWEEQGTYLGPDAGLHANIGETAIMLAINPDSVDMTEAVAGWPAPPEGMETDKLAAIIAAVMPLPGSMARVSPTGGWGDPTQATAEKGEAYLQMITKAVVRFVLDVEKTYEKMYG
jgi:creatinine amidohydrolase